MEEGDRKRLQALRDDARAHKQTHTHTLAHAGADVAWDGRTLDDRKGEGVVELTCSSFSSSSSLSCKSGVNCAAMVYGCWSSKMRDVGAGCAATTSW